MNCLGRKRNLCVVRCDNVKDFEQHIFLDAVVLHPISRLSERVEKEVE